MKNPLKIPIQIFFTLTSRFPFLAATIDNLNLFFFFRFLSCHRLEFLFFCSCMIFSYLNSNVYVFNVRKFITKKSNVIHVCFSNYDKWMLDNIINFIYFQTLIYFRKLNLKCPPTYKLLLQSI